MAKQVNFEIGTIEAWALSKTAARESAIEKAAEFICDVSHGPTVVALDGDVWAIWRSGESSYSARSVITCGQRREVYWGASSFQSLLDCVRANIAQGLFEREGRIGEAYEAMSAREKLEFNSWQEFYERYQEIAEREPDWSIDEWHAYAGRDPGRRDLWEAVEA